MRPVLGIAHTRELSPDSIPHHKHDVKGLLDLSHEEYEKYIQADKTLQSFIAGTQLFTMALWDYQDYYRLY